MSVQHLCICVLQQNLSAFPGRLDDFSALLSASVAGFKVEPLLFSKIFCPLFHHISSSFVFCPFIPSFPQAAAPPPPPPEEEEEADEEETEDLGHADTYAEYKPSKSTIGISHPDFVVETNTLSSVPPPDITYTLSIPVCSISSGLLSALQLEAIIYACQQHEVILQNGQRAGFLIGDGAGVGKGRTVAGIILENFLKGRKRALWFSVSNDLKYDAERDLKDIDASNIPVFALNKIKYGDTATSEGVLFATYSALIGESQAGGQHRTRLKQILDWCKPNFDGVIVFDECHKAKNATSTKMGKAVLDLQSKLPRARVVYASATGASEPKNMIYMSRLGIWGQGTPFRAFDDFLHAIEKRGVGAMEIVAMDMKVSGMYIARQLSFSGVSFRIEEITLDEEFKLVYNKAARLWAEALELFTRAADTLGLASRKSLWGQFWASHQRFFKYLCIAAKVRRLVDLAHTEMQHGKCIVIGLQSTGEALSQSPFPTAPQARGNVSHIVLCCIKHYSVSGVWVCGFLCIMNLSESNSLPSEGKPRGRTSKFPKHCVEVGGVIKISDDSDSDSDEIDSDSNSSPDSLQDSDDVIFVNHINGPGALTHGDRRATESRDLSQYNFENKYGTKALDKITKAILGHIDNKVPPPKGYPGGDIMFFRGNVICLLIKFDQKYCTITKFLNRILGLEVHQQNSLFQYFTDNFDYLINKDKKEGKYDMGILDLAPGNDEIHEETQEKFLTPGNPQEGQVILYKISVDRGMPWEEACSKAEKLTGDYEGFYLSNKGRGRNLILYKPNIGKQAHPENLDNLLLRYYKVQHAKAIRHCKSLLHFNSVVCLCVCGRNGKCKLIEQGQECFLGMRLRQYHMLCGALLRVWKRVSDIVSDITNSSILQIVRLKTKQNSKQVGELTFCYLLLLNPVS
uniref:Protein strawberry notch homolog 2 n=1 Tax=Sinocyclocheilus anshuiensis TaxID=1608454 RepID=A0A671LTT6_9TELE